MGGSALLSFNGVVGAAIFALPATLLVDWGTFSPWLFLIVAVAALLVIIPFTRSAAAFTESGGPATYGLVFGRLAGFELGWIYYVAKVAGCAANLNVLADYVARWWSGAGDGAGRVAAILFAWTALIVINLFGMKRALACLSGFTLVKAVPLIAVAVAAVVLFWPPPVPAIGHRATSLDAGFLIIFYAFVGFENAVIPTGETKEPASTLPRAVGLTILGTALLYFVIQLGYVSAFRDAPSPSKAPMLDLGALVAGQLGAVVLTLAAICSLLGNLLGASASTPRVTYAMGTRGERNVQSIVDDDPSRGAAHGRDAARGEVEKRPSRQIALADLNQMHARVRQRAHVRDQRVEEHAIGCSVARHRQPVPVRDRIDHRLHEGYSSAVCDRPIVSDAADCRPAYTERSSLTPATTLMMPSPETAPRTKLLIMSARSTGTNDAK